ncbi:ABC multidrug transporter MDR5, partial [Pseudocercospora fuligena]
PDAKDLYITPKIPLEMPPRVEWKSQPSYIRVFQYADHVSWLLNGMAFLTAIVSGFATPAMCVVFGEFTTAFVEFDSGEMILSTFKHETNRLRHVSDLYLVYLFLAKLVCAYTSTVCSSIAALSTTMEMRKDYLKSLLQQETAYFENPHMSRSPALDIAANANVINQGIAENLALVSECSHKHKTMSVIAFVQVSALIGVGQVIQGFSTFGGAIIVAFVVQWKLAVMTFAIVPFVIIVTGICLAVDAKVEGGLAEIYNRAGETAAEVFASIKDVQIFSLHAMEAEKYDAMLANAVRMGMRKRPNQGILFASDDFAIFCGYAVAFWRGVRMYRDGEVASVGQVVTVILAMIAAATFLRQIASQLIVIDKAARAANRLFGRSKIIDRQTLLDPLSSEGIRPEDCSGELRFEDVQFVYPSRPEARVLRNINMSMSSGQMTTIVGASGCGKSTIMKLLLRCYGPTAGRVLLDGVNIDELNLKWLRTTIRAVEQEPLLFSGTILENVMHGLTGTVHEDSTPEQKRLLVEEACKVVNAHEFIQELPESYDTLIRSQTLSGGQKQRLAIARAIVADPAILIMDEPTSALDVETEARLIDTIRQRSRTCILVTHSIVLAQRADKVIFLEEGALRSQGHHEHLLRHDRKYAELFAAGQVDSERPRSVNGADIAVPIDGDKACSSLVHVSALESTSDTNMMSDHVNHGVAMTLVMLFREQKSLWPLCAMMAFVCCLAGTVHHLSYSNKTRIRRLLWLAVIFTIQAIILARMLEAFKDRHGARAVIKADFWALMFFVIALAEALIWFFLGWGSVTVSQLPHANAASVDPSRIANANIHQRLARSYRLRIFESLLRQSTEFFDAHGPGSLTAKLATIAMNLQELMSVNVFLIWMDCIIIVCSSIFGIAKGPQLGLLCVFAALPPILVSGYLRVRLESKLEASTMARFDDSASFATETISAHRVVAMFTLESTMMARYSKQLSGLTRKSVPAISVIMLWYALSQSIQFLSFALGFWYGARLVSQGKYSMTQFVEIFVAIFFGGEAASAMFQYSSSISKALISANSMFHLQQSAQTRDGNSYHPQDNEKPFDTGVQGAPPSIRFDSVSFTYPYRPEKRALENIDISIESGQFVAFVGRSGSGKSTMLNLLCRLYGPTSGQILVNHAPICDVPVQTYRRLIGLVEQEPRLHRGTIRENIVLGLAGHSVTDADIQNACMEAQIWDFVQSLPEGTNSHIGGSLSGGQKQRLALARALIRKPKILLLDEATSALDVEGERAVEEAVFTSNKDRTTIVVAHRLNTIRGADVIYVFHQGQIVESGRHEELLRKSGRYWSMWRCQEKGLAGF